jgi:hypothetical protein
MLSSSCTAAGIGSSFSGYIAVCEAVARDRRDTPCVGPIGLGVTGVLFAFGVASTTAVSIAIFHFLASVPQPLSPVLAVLLLVAAALCLPRQSTNLAPSGVAPNPWLLGAVALLATSIFKEVPRTATSPRIHVGGCNSRSAQALRSCAGGPDTRT